MPPIVFDSSRNFIGDSFYSFCLSLAFSSTRFCTQLAVIASSSHGSSSSAHASCSPKTGYCHVGYVNSFPDWVPMYLISLAQFLPGASAEITHNLLRNVIVASLINLSTLVTTQRTTIQLLAAIARFSPSVIVPILSDVVPGILKASSQDDDEQRESSLSVRICFMA